MVEVTHVLSRIEAGDEKAAQELLPLVYDELRKLAECRMASERPDHTLQATALVHEAYLRLVDVEKVQHWGSRRHFFSAAAEAMRRILIDSARRRKSLRCGGDRQAVGLEDLAGGSSADIDLLLDLDAALVQLADKDPEVAELVRLRLFAGLSVTEAGSALGMARRTAYDNWSYARSWFAAHFGEIKL